MHKTVCHQVGEGHRRLLCETLGVDLGRDFSTLDWLGNTGSVALPTALALALEGGAVEPDDQVALLGIGSGINCIMLGMQFATVPATANNTAAVSATS